MEFKGSWDTHLALMEFAYNNSYQASIEMAPFEALYGRKCRTYPNFCVGVRDPGRYPEFLCGCKRPGEISQISVWV